MEVAAGAVAFEAVTTTLEGAALGGVALSRSTLPLKARLTRFATTPDEKAVELLHLSHHTVSFVNDQAYIFSGQNSERKPAGSETHIFNLKPSAGEYSYKCIPAVPAHESGSVPGPRYGHSANVVEGRIYVFGGAEAEDSPLEETIIWQFDPETLRWSALELGAESSRPQARYNHASAVWGSTLLIFGGRSMDSKLLKDIWAFHLEQQTWSRLPDLDMYDNIGEPAMAVVDDTVYVVGHIIRDNRDRIETVLHFLDLTSGLSKWQEIITPIGRSDARGRTGASLVPIDTGMGRKYLIYSFGRATNTESANPAKEEFYNDIWAYQLEASVKSPAGIKDATNEALGFGSDRSTWAEVVIQAEQEPKGIEGESHPGPRAFVATALMDANTIVLWGGMNAKGDKEGDGWIIRFDSS